MEREQIIKALECCKTPLASDCENCSYTGKRLEDGVYEGCVNCLVGDALSLIKELTEENERLRGERAKFFEYKHGTLVRNALVLTKNKKEFDDFCKAIKADTVRKMQERILEHASNGYPRKVRVDVIDQIVKEMTEGT